MDWIIGIQRAVDYIEEHLTENIDYEKVAAESFSSSYHFDKNIDIYVKLIYNIFIIKLDIHEIFKI